MKKKQALLAAAFVLTFLLGGVAGRVYQDLRNGYHLEVLWKKSFWLPDGEVTLSHVVERIGMRFLETQTSVVDVHTRFGPPITVYKAKRVFQESYPFVESISTEKNRILWSDGINEYQLTVEPIKTEAAPES